MTVLAYLVAVGYRELSSAKQVPVRGFLSVCLWTHSPFGVLDSGE